MPEITLVRQDHVDLTEQQRETLRTALFGMFDGLGEDDRKAWRRFWHGLMRLQIGEIASIDTWLSRHGGFHRRHMLLETSVFRAQERIASFEQFRVWLKVGSGFVDWMPGPKGGVVPVPRSISFRKCDEVAMRQFHDDAMAFLRTEHAIRYLWPHLPPARGAEMLQAVLGRFGE
mgnify:CR=1 FL=1|jgi:Protein of unknown function (DUF1367).